MNKKQQLLDKFKELEAGDYIDYNEIFKQIDSTPEAENRNIYRDSVGFLESVELEGQQIAVIDGLAADTMIRQIDTHKIEELEGDKE